MSKKHPSAYANLTAINAENPRRYGHYQTELDRLGRKLKHFDNGRRLGNTHDAEFKLGAKIAVLGLLNELDRASPNVLKHLELDGMTDHPVKAGSGEIAALVDDLEDLQSKARFSNDAAEKANFTTQSAAKLEDVLTAVTMRRTLLQAKRPRIDPARRDVYVDIDLALYTPYVRAMAAASAKDHADPKTQRALYQLPHLSHIGKEAQAFVAMLDFSEAVQGVVSQCRDKPDTYWDENRSTFQKQLRQAAERFNEAVRPLQLKVNATNPAYKQCILAEERISKAISLTSIKAAHAMLKSRALEFVVGGEDKWNDKPKHKLFTRVSEAYRADRQLIKKQADAHEHTHDAFVHPFESPLDEPSHLLNRVYEARWALLADAIAEAANSYKLTIANPEIVAPSAKAPEAEPPHAMTRRQLATLQRRAQQTEVPDATVQDVVSKGRTVLQPQDKRRR